MQPLTPLKQIRGMLTNRPAKTRTFRVRSDVLSMIQLDKQVKLRRMTAAEIKELAEYLEVNGDQLNGPFKVVEASCTNCERRITFLDFVQSGVSLGVHTKEELGYVLMGGAGAWLTIRGQDGGRPVTCFNCGQPVPMAGYCEYASASYAYA